MSRAKQPTPPKPVDYGDSLEYLAQYRDEQIRTFARFVIARGYGASAPNNVGTEEEPQYETWQQVGRRLYGPKFVEVFRDELEKHSAANRKSA